MQSRLILSVHQSPESERLLRDPAFNGDWAGLADRCPWSTVYQRPDFIHSWLEVYAGVTEPIVVEGRTEAGLLCGLFLLSRRKATGEILVAGDKHCEYQAWLAEPENNDSFILAALEALAAATGARRLTLTFVPRSVPLGWLSSEPAWRDKHWIDTETNSYLDLGPGFKPEQLRAYRSYRQRLNKVAKLPGVRIEYCAEPSAFERELTAIADIVDFRQGARNGILPFRDDPQKAAFHARLAAIPGLLHCTLLWIDDRLASVEVNLRHKDTLIHGMLAHRPEYSRYSLGRFHMLRLAELAAQQGISCFDLTPSGEYKDDFATRSEEAYIVRLYFTRFGMALFRLRRKATGFLSATARQRLGKAIDHLREINDRLARTTIRALAATAVRRVRNKIFRFIELRLYRWPSGRPLPCQPGPFSAANSLGHLLTYRPLFAWQPSRPQFLATASSRLEAGDTCFTRMENGVLAHYGWMGWRKSIRLDEVSQEQALEQESVVLYDFFTHPSFRGRGYYQTTLNEALSGLRDLPPGTPIYMSVAADNHPSRRVIEKAGFELCGRYFQRTLLLNVRRWRQLAAEHPPAQYQESR